MESLEEQLKDETLDHETRAQIGEELNRIGDTRAGVGLRPDGLPDIAWCRVDVSAEKRLFRNERGQVYGEFVLKPFSIAKYPVTYQQFRTFHESPDGFNNEQWWEGLTEKYRQQEILDQRSLFDNHPRDSVSWYQAVAFARWLDAKYAGEMPSTEIRLPLEWEWQWAAQGYDERSYPWGKPDQHFANTRECRLGRTTAVGVYPQGQAWCGALDMSGNVWEWCLNEYGTPTHAAYEGHNSRVLRGGSFVDVAEWAVCGSRFNDLPNRRLDYFGFRVVRVTR